MPRSLRFIRPGVVHELTRRTRRGRFAFAPTRRLVAALIGVVAEAQRRWPQIRLHQIVFKSNHVHLMLSVDGPAGANALGQWTCYLFGQSAKVAKAVHGLKGEIWESKRYRLIPILDDASLRARKKYLMAQAVTAGLVAKPRQWPGLNSCDALCRGVEIVGYRASAGLRRRAKALGVPVARLAPRRAVRLCPLPSQRHWTVHERRAWHRAIEREIIEEAAAERPRRRYAPPESLRAISPHRTVDLVETPAPRCHAAEGNHEARQRWRDAYIAFVDAWRLALTEWVRGAKPCFPPDGWVPFGACYAPGYAQRV